MDNPEDRGGSCFADDFDFRQPRPRFYKVLRPRAGGEVRALILSDLVTIARTHYQQRSTYACTRDPKTCKFCKFGVDVRVKGYLAAQSMRGGERVLVEMTYNAMKEHPQIRERKVSLRGKVIVLRRPGEHANSPVFASLETCYQASLLKNLPQPFDVRAACLAMWDIPSYVEHIETGEVRAVNRDRFFDEDDPEAIPTGS